MSTTSQNSLRCLRMPSICHLRVLMHRHFASFNVGTGGSYVCIGVTLTFCSTPAELDSTSNGLTGVNFGFRPRRFGGGLKLWNKNIIAV